MIICSAEIETVIERGELSAVVCSSNGVAFGNLCDAGMPPTLISIRSRRQRTSFKLWLRAGAIAILSLALSSTIAVAQGHGHGQDKHDRDDDDGDDTHGRGHGHKGYSDHDRDEVRGRYREHHDHLPPGLAKRDRLPPGLERQLIVRGTLPPGLRAKMYRVPEDFERRLPPPPPNCEHVFIGGHVVLLNRTNFQIVDVIHVDVY
jgi:Ni/Co efflux regulator RcnB